MILVRTNESINRAEDAGTAHVKIRFSGYVAAGFADEADQLYRISWSDLPGDVVRPKFSNI